MKVHYSADEANPTSVAYTIVEASPEEMAQLYRLKQPEAINAWVAAHAEVIE